jgi:Flp pilus assembly protein protease CpaA
MLNYDNLLIAIALLFCSYASYTDLKYGKVPNICSFGLIYAGTVAQVMFIFEGSTSVGYSSSVVILSGFIAFAFYWFGIMAPGDAKLFWGVCITRALNTSQSLAKKID